VPPVGTLQSTLEPSQLAGASVDSGAARVRFADRRLYVDSLRITQSGLVTTGSGSLGWTRGTGGQLALDFGTDSLTALDPLVGWLGGGSPDPLDDPGGGSRGDARNTPLAGAARVLLTLEGSLDSLGLDARASVERLAWRAWRVPAGALPTRGRADAHLQLEGFPLVGLYALLERDTAGVGGTVTVTAGLSGTRASPVSSGSFSLSNGAFGEFRAPFMDGTFDYHD